MCSMILSCLTSSPFPVGVAGGIRPAFTPTTNDQAGIRQAVRIYPRDREHRCVGWRRETTLALTSDSVNIAVLLSSPSGEVMNHNRLVLGIIGVATAGIAAMAQAPTAPAPNVPQ